MSGSSVELQEVGCVSALSPRERRECLPVSVIAARREEWPTSQLTQRMNLQQQGMSWQMVEVGLAAVGEDLQAVAEALHTCQAAHAQVGRCADFQAASEITASRQNATSM
ncbi:uncharacterized protein LOC119433948 isoform X3 [Dermacentor silvarum]|uniref:uncharacterized protein LOC119433948 isoform X3 n=1 Tax=Dermacentor silvarum TaxID=543639 RepID=UPI002101CD46|nr:uncharacterized protein LOC119433948 isoform X3 [Dermacentor silvarum]